MTARPFRTLSIIVACFSWALSTAAAQSLLRDAEIELFLEDLSTPLLEAAGLQPEAVSLYLVGDNSLNAFVAGGQNIFIHTGLLTAADTPNQIEGVIAHEIGHIAGGHLQRGADVMATASRPVLLSLVLGAAAIAAGAPPEAGIAISGLGQRVALGDILAHSRGQEASADQAAVTYLEATGQSGQGLVEFFGKLANRQLASSRNVDPYLLTHPLAIRRINALRDKVQGLEHYDSADSEDEIIRLQMIQGKILGFMQDPYITLRTYPLSDKSAPARYARAVAYYRKSELERGLKEIDSLIDEQPDNPYFAELKGQMLFEHGQIAESVVPHRRSVALAPGVALFKINLGRALVALEREGDMDEAVEVLKSGLALEPDNGFGWSELARAYAALGRDDLASLAQAQAFFSYGNEAQAHRFATRASEKLEPGTPEHLQALDIIAATVETARRARAEGSPSRMN